MNSQALSVTFAIIMVFSCFFYGEIFAADKHKILVTNFTDPPKWDKPFSPGKVLTIHLKNQFAQKKQVILLPDKSINSTKMSGSLMENKSNMNSSSASSSFLNNVQISLFVDSVESK